MKFKFIVVLLFSIFLIGCGGSKDSSLDNLFSGATLAKPTQSNAQEVEDILISFNAQSQTDLYNGRLISAKKRSFLNNILTQIKSIEHKLLQQNKNRYFRYINDTQECLNGGSMDIVGDIEEPYDSKFNLEFNSCDNGFVTYDGVVEISVSNYDYYLGGYKKLTMRYLSNFDIYFDGKTQTIQKGSYLEINYITRNTMKLTMSVVYNENGLKGFRDATFYVESSGDLTFIYQSSGRIYINNLNEYVILDKNYDMSLTPLTYELGNIKSGEAHYKMDGTILKIIIENGVATLDY